MNGLIQAPEINLDLNEPLDDDLGGIEDLSMQQKILMNSHPLDPSLRTSL
jgi:hypothetical protein